MEKKISPLFHNIFNKPLTSRVQLHIYLSNVVVRIIFSSILQIWYVEVRISRGISESPLEFEITRVDCIFSSLNFHPPPRKKFKWVFSFANTFIWLKHILIFPSFTPKSPTVYCSPSSSYRGVYLILTGILIPTYRGPDIMTILLPIPPLPSNVAFGGSPTKSSIAFTYPGPNPSCRIFLINQPL